MYGVYQIYFSNISVYRSMGRAAENKMKTLPMSGNVCNCWNKRKNAIVYRTICSMVAAS